MKTFSESEKLLACNFTDFIVKERKKRKEKNLSYFPLVVSKLDFW